MDASSSQIHRAKAKTSKGHNLEKGKSNRTWRRNFPHLEALEKGLRVCWTFILSDFQNSPVQSPEKLHLSLNLMFFMQELSCPDVASNLNYIRNLVRTQWPVLPTCRCQYVLLNHKTLYDIQTNCLLLIHDTHKIIWKEGWLIRLWISGKHQFPGEVFCIGHKVAAPAMVKYRCTDQRQQSK